MSAEVGQVLDQPTLADLLETIVTLQAELEAHAEQALLRAIKIGDALMVAQRLTVSEGEWTRWCKANLPFDRSTGEKYMRLAAFADALPDGLSVSAAVRYLREHGLRRTPGITRVTSEVVEAVGVLADQGLDTKAIAGRLGVSWGTVKGIRDPEWGREKARRHAASQARLRQRRRSMRAAELRREQDKAVKATPFSNVYAEIHALTGKVGAFADNAATPEYRTIANAALAKLHEARDEIVKGLGL